MDDGEGIWVHHIHTCTLLTLLQQLKINGVTPELRLTPDPQPDWSDDLMEYHSSPVVVLVLRVCTKLAPLHHTTPTFTHHTHTSLPTSIHCVISYIVRAAV